MSSLLTDRKEALRQRFSGPWSPNPWFNAHRMGPRNDHGIHGSLAAIAEASTLPEIPSPMVEPDSATALRRKNRKQQQTALNRWENEGGQNA